MQQKSLEIVGNMKVIVLSLFDIEINFEEFN
jgi:hypothetical protein